VSKRHVRGVTRISFRASPSNPHHLTCVCVCVCVCVPRGGEGARGDVACFRPLCCRAQRQYLYFRTSKARKLSTYVGAVEDDLQDDNRREHSERNLYVYICVYEALSY
jgi:hypothetical protein